MTKKMTMTMMTMMMMTMTMMTMMMMMTIHHFLAGMRRLAEE